MRDPAGEKRRQRPVAATDSEWEAVRANARAAGMGISRFVIERCAVHAPEPAAEPRTGPRNRIEGRKEA